ncbi:MULTISPECIES: protein kinase domain-containing protein [unclassified Cryobacterium]|uniref:protein kinase domain-containing protein n=1 Tax=unclassified Cryobacterium TaxID=2649013 RepID=UPI002AB3969E|nr:MULTISPECIES: PASTA domain-containing protein [unclassified Cryobacterium]MDY7542991.1 PASTA domain-containing protein [Cryobacterium sp. 5B3]MEA9999288.1 PASTA domain-containing protein [Cryobacterium sp. RTS3]MEB0265962.1 PASTA domain-containing protein [Cryobacterium sp. 10I5]MEB0274066.1 PASTA domain-containing protein [Cryobacterium sp. 5B3]
MTDAIDRAEPTDASGAQAGRRTARAGAGLISGRYRLGELLGTGGSASVFAAVDTQAGEGAATEIALKILHPHLSRSDRAREAFFAEARAAAALRHPNIVAVLGVGVHNTGHGSGTTAGTDSRSGPGANAEEPQAWIALDRAPGISLAEYVEHRGALPVAQALTVASAVLRALAAAHAIGLVHRDVSPANIMVNPDMAGHVGSDGVRLLDFGLADAAGRPALGTDVLRSTLDATTQEIPAVQSVLGSVNYMSPEQARGDAVDERGDVYQLGGVLYFALTARAPFLRDSVAAVLRAHVQSPPPVPSVQQSGIPRSVDRLVVKALLKDPDARFPSAAAMGVAVDSALDRIGAGGAPGRSAAPLEGAPAGGVLAAPSDDTTGLFRPGDLAELAERTRVLGAVPVPVPGPAPAPATIVHATGNARAGTASAAVIAVPDNPAWVRNGRSRRRGGGLWAVSMILVIGGAFAWILAAGGAAPTSVAVTSSTPAPASATPEPMITAHATAAPKTIRVPEVSVMTLDGARAALAALGLRLGALTLQDSVRPLDTVLGVSPAAGSFLDPGDTVDLTVASGSNTVPNTVGLSKAEAIAALENAGFVVLTDSKPDSAAPPGTVIAVAPSGQNALRLGTSITLTVSTAPEPSATPTATSTPQPTPTPTPSPTQTPAG